jgi:peptidoglycan-N-acetylglucosamine deacetylase
MPRACSGSFEARRLAGAGPVILRSLKRLVLPALGTITHVATREDLVALTFDDGPDPMHTPRVLEVLARYDARATFFMVGLNAQRHPGVVDQVIRGGHAVGNHTWDHRSLPHLSTRERLRQVRACAGILRPHASRLFRSPGGHQTPRSVLDVRLLGFQVIGWNVDPRDYSARSAEELADQVLEELRPGAIVLLHDHLFDRPSSDRRASIDAVDLILAGAGGRFRFVTVPELLRAGQPARIHAYWRPGGVPEGAPA